MYRAMNFAYVYCLCTHNDNTDNTSTWEIQFYRVRLQIYSLVPTDIEGKLHNSYTRLWKNPLGIFLFFSPCMSIFNFEIPAVTC